MDKFAALRQAKEDDPQLPEGYWGADHPKCPHCGHVCGISENDWWRLHEEGEHEVSCPSCDMDFTVTTRVSYSFSTDQQNEEGADDDQAWDRNAERMTREALGADVDRPINPHATSVDDL